MCFLCHTLLSPPPLLLSPLLSSPLRPSLSWPPTIEYRLNALLPLLKSADIGRKGCWKSLHRPQETGKTVCACQCARLQVCIWHCLCPYACSFGQRLGRTQGPQQVTGLRLLWVIWLWRQMCGCRPLCACVRSLARVGSQCRERPERLDSFFKIIFLLYWELNG